MVCKSLHPLLNKHFSEEDMQVASMYMKRHSNHSPLGKHKVKTTMNYHFTPIKSAIMKNIRDNRCWWGCGEKATLVHCWRECKLVQLQWKTVWRPFKNLIELLYDSAFLLLSRYPKEAKSKYKRLTCTFVFITVLFSIAKIRK